MRFESIGQYHDCWAPIVLYAPDSFKSFDGVRVPDQAAALDEAFELIRSGLGLAQKKVKDDRLMGVVRELIDMSHEAYRAGHRKLGAHILQECEGLIWPSSAGKLKYVVDAEQRRFGELRLFKDVKVSRYPYEGTAKDLGPRQRMLLEHSRQQSQRFIDANEAFQSFTWAMHADGSVRPVRATSRKKMVAFLQAAAASGEMVACSTAHLPFGSLGGLFAVHLEEAGCPRAEVIAVISSGIVDAPHYHLNDPEIFLPSAAKT